MTVVDWSDEVESRWFQSELQRFLRHALDELRPSDRAVVVLPDLDELSSREIGEILAFSVAGVKARL